MRVRAVVALILLTVLSCTSDTKPAAVASSSSPPPKTGPVYAAAGPYKVGYATLHLNIPEPGRDVAVWYPADDAAVAGKTEVTYDQRTPLPDDLKGVVPAEYNTVTTMHAFADAAASRDGPFPVVLFGHGLSAYRLVNSALEVGLASWGFVVVSADYLERGLVAQVKGTTSIDAARDRTIMLDTLDLIDEENARDGSTLKGIVDRRRVATVGHSLGGQVAFDALDDPRVAVAVGWAPVAPSRPPVGKPTLIVGAGGDIALTPDALTKEYTAFVAPKRLVEIGGAAAGHNTFTDVCAAIRQGGGLIEFARKNNLVKGALVDLGENGCHPTDLAPETFQPIVQHFTVAELRAVFGLDPQPVGLDDAITTAFGDVPIEYHHDP